MAVGDARIDQTFLLDTLKPTAGQRRLARIVAVAVVVAFAITVPFASHQLPHVEAFISLLQGIFFLSDLITAILLLSQCSISGSGALLILAAGYLFSALIVNPWALSFPGAFSPAGLLGGSRESTPWLYNFWHSGFSLSLLAYAWWKDKDPRLGRGNVSARFMIGVSLVIVFVVVCGLVWLATAGVGVLPPQFSEGGSHYTSVVYYASLSIIAVNVATLALLFKRGPSLLDQWLMVVTLALISEMALGGIFISQRFSFGFYTGRAYTLVTSVTVLAVLIVEIIKLDARLAYSNMMLQRERESKMINLAAMAGAISHEMRQPLMAIAMNCGAAVQFLEDPSPDIEEVRSTLTTIVNDAHRAGQIFESIGSLFRGEHQQQDCLDINRIVIMVLHILDRELKEHAVTARLELASGLPKSVGHRGQLQEVVLNLVMNALESMVETEGGARILTVRTARHGAEEVAVMVEDSGKGIEPKRLAKLFDPFVTSKPQGMGLGLAICHMIVERHGGHISARAGSEGHGAVLHFTLPIRLPLDRV